MPGGQCITKPFFLEPHHFADEIALCFEFGKGSAEAIDDLITDFVEKGVIQAEMFASVIYRTPHYLAKNVIAAFVAGQYAVSDRKRGRPSVIGYHAAGKLLCF
jgi:hypothetical protein